MKNGWKKDVYKSWLRKDDKNSNRAFCFACNESFDSKCNGKVGLADPYVRQEPQRILHKKSSRQWEDHKNILDVNRNIFLGFEVKFSLKKSLKFPSRVLESPWKVLEFLAWTPWEEQKMKNPQSICFACFNILSSFFWETKVQTCQKYTQGCFATKLKAHAKFREFYRISPKKIICVSLAPIHSIMFTLELIFFPFDHILFYWNCCVHFSFDSFKRMGMCHLITTTLMICTLSSVFLWVWLQILNQLSDV